MKSLLIIIALGLLSLNIGAQNREFESSLTSSQAFVENQGQFDGRDWHSNHKIEYAMAQNPFYIFFTKEGLTYRLDKIVKNPKRDKTDPESPKRTNISELVHLTWLGANENVKIIASDPKSNYYSYAVKDWETGAVNNLSNVKGYSKILYQDLYDHVDVEYLFHPDGGIKYSVILHPGADPSQIKLAYTSSHTGVMDEFVNVALGNDGKMHIKTSLGEIIEHEPYTFVASSLQEVSSSFQFSNNILTFDLGNYDPSETIVIDPWVNSPTYSTSTAVWEVETDNAGNVYTIGGETPMQLKKHNAAGVLQWTYTTPWDTATVWLGTLATDAGGTSYITSGTTPEIERVDNGGTMIWHNASGGGFGQDTEYWTISFNCDKTKLIVGGTKFVGLTDVYAAIFDIDITNGNVISDVTFAYTNIFGGFGVTPEEVRSISSARNAKFIYLTHNQVGAINQNLATCPTVEPTFQVDNTHHLGYKCENYLPATQNGGGLKALVANDNYFYTHSGDQIHQWDLNTGAQLNTVNLPGGASSTVPIVGGTVVECSGLAVDDCGNVYAGSTNQVVKYDANLSQLSSSPTSFSVYDVSVNNNGEVLAVGAQSDNSATNRNGRIESIAMSACAQYTLVCCDASFCEQDALCVTDAAVNLIPATPGGTWSGPGVNPTTGVFDPAVAGAGTHTITYTLVCGDESHDIVVSNCAALTACLESNGDVTVTSGTGPFTWYEYQTGGSTPITNQSQCTACGYSWNSLFGQCLDGFTPVTSCTQSAGYAQFATGTTVTPSVYPIYVIDAVGDSLIINAAGDLTACSSTCTPPTLAGTTTDVTCAGGTDGAIDVTVTGSSTYGYAWSNSATTVDLSGIASGNYTITVTDQADATCTATATYTINDGSQPTVTAIASTNNVCPGDPVTLTGSGATTYTWDNGVTDGVPFGAPTSTTVYTVTGTDGSGCTNTASVTLTVVTCTTPNAAFTPSSASICAGDCIDFTNNSTNIPPGSLFGWSFSGATPSTNTTDTDPTNVCYPTAGTYWVTLAYSDFSFNLVDSTGIAITVGTCSCTPPTLAGSVSNVSCAGGTDGAIDVTVTGSSTYTYAWSNSASTEDISGVAAGSYTITVTDQTDPTCTATDTYSVVDGASPSVVANASATTICTGDAVTLTGSGTASSYTWDNGVTDGVAFNPTATNTYTVTGTDGSGCTATDVVTVNVSTCTGPTASFTVSPSTTICEGDCIGFVNTSVNVPTGAFTVWNFPGATPSNSTQNSPANICYNVSGSYWATLVIMDASLTVLDSTGVAITVTTCNPPVADFTFSPSGPYCSGDCITFSNTSSFTSPATFLWDFDNGQTNTFQNPGSAICYNTPGSYDVTLTVTDNFGTSTVSQTIVISDCTPPSAGFTLSDNSICDGECITINNGSSNADTYQWTFNGGIPSSSNLADPGIVCFSGPGVYDVSLVVTNAYGNDSIGTQVTVHENPTVEASDDMSILVTTEVQLEAISPDPNVTYVWSPSIWIDCPDCQNTAATPLDTVFYIVTATNEYGCSDTAGVLIEVEIIEAIGVPSAFSPNGDGVNDVLYVQGYGINNMEFRVYNRYGQMVFESFDQSYGWDGNFQGRPEDTGVFVYYVIYKNNAGEELMLEGDVTLMR